MSVLKLFFTLGIENMEKPEVLEFEDDALCEKIFRGWGVLFPSLSRAALCKGKVKATGKSVQEACPKTCNTEVL